MANESQEQWKENLNMQLLCHECKEVPPNLVEEFSSGDVVCGSCGIVLSGKTVDTRSEWRTFANDDQGNDDPSRVGDAANPLFDGAQLETAISYDGGGRSRDLHRAQNKSFHDKSNKTLMSKYKELTDLCHTMDVMSTIVVYAKFLQKQIHDAGAFRGKSQEAINAGLIFIACRQHGVPRTFKEIHGYTNISKAEVGRMFKALEKFFATQNVLKKDKLEKAGDGVNPQEVYASTKSADPKEYCSRFCSRLKLPYRITSISEEIAVKTDKLGSLAGRSPLSIAAACIYMASHLMKQPKAPKDIAQAAGVSDGTLRHAYKLIYPKRQELVDPEWKGDLNALPSG